MPSDNYALFIRQVQDIFATSSVAGVLDWDQET